MNDLTKRYKVFEVCFAALQLFSLWLRVKRSLFLSARLMPPPSPAGTGRLNPLLESSVRIFFHTQDWVCLMHSRASPCYQLQSLCACDKTNTAFDTKKLIRKTGKSVPCLFIPLWFVPLIQSHGLKNKKQKHDWKFSHSLTINRSNIIKLKIFPWLINKNIMPGGWKQQWHEVRKNKSSTEATNKIFQVLCELSGSNILASDNTCAWN